MIAIVDQDGWRPAVWGLGDTEEAARKDAAAQEDYERTEADAAVTLTDEQAATLASGDAIEIPSVSVTGAAFVRTVTLAAIRRPGADQRATAHAAWVASEAARIAGAAAATGARKREDESRIATRLGVRSIADVDRMSAYLDGNERALGAGPEDTSDGPAYPRRATR